MWDTNKNTFRLSDERGIGNNVIDANGNRSARCAFIVCTKRRIPNIHNGAMETIRPPLTLPCFSIYYGMIFACGGNVSHRRIVPALRWNECIILPRYIFIYLSIYFIFSYIYLLLANECVALALHSFVRSLRRANNSTSATITIV